MEVKETFLPNHLTLSDDELLKPLPNTFTESKMFVCTFVAKLTNLHIDFIELTQLLCKNVPEGNILAINSNFGHISQADQAAHLKLLKKVKKIKNEPRKRPRKIQGDGTCFNSAIEPVIKIDNAKLPANKVYYIKCFPSTGEIQIPGVILPTFEDGTQALEVFINYLNKLGIGDIDSATLVPKKISIEYTRPKMINHKFNLIRSSPRILIALSNLYLYVSEYERLKLFDGTEQQPIEKLSEWEQIPPPFQIRESKFPIDDVKVSFKIVDGARTPRVNIFQSGKINILGTDSLETSEKIYKFFIKLFEKNRAKLILLQPKRDKIDEDKL